MPDSLLIALGGNALIKAGQKGTLDEQAHNLDECLSGLVEPIRNGTRLVFTHGNGPQVGYILIRALAARDQAYDLPLDVCVAQSQGEMGYLIQQRLQHLLHRRHIHRRVVTLLTQTLVDPDDPRMQHPSKPIGPFYSEKEAGPLQQQGTCLVHAGPQGYRRVVPSPDPLTIIETEEIRHLVEEGVIVIAVGGGGIPVYRGQDGLLHGIEAVVDKDLASSLLANTLGFVRLLNLTAVDHAKLWYGSPEEQNLQTLSDTQATQYLAEGHFAPGSMGPKIEAAIQFVKNGGRECIITATNNAREGLEGKIGTHLFQNEHVPSHEITWQSTTLPKTDS